MSQLFFIAIGFGSLAIGSTLGYLARQSIAKRQLGSIEEKIATMVESAKTEAKDIVFRAKDRAVKFLEDAKREEKRMLDQVMRQSDRISRKEEVLDKKNENIERDKRDLDHKIVQVKQIKADLAKMQEEENNKLISIANMTENDARDELLKNVERDYGEEIIKTIKKLETERKDAIEKKAFDIMASAIQRYARSNVADVTTSIVNIPDNDLKGRIIGREGRNIKALERATGIEVIVDETPGVITISGFDPIRREVARLALDKLIKDGRIQPAKIEEKVEEAREDIRKKIQEMGEAAVFETGIIGLPSQVVHLLGRLHFRTSYGQNVLLHSIEATHLAGMLARELGVNVEIAKKGALLHDIGKSVDHEIEGTHVELGRRILEKYGIEREVIQAMESHHEDYPFSTPESFVVAAAEATSAARPGARKDTLENYLKRLEELEKIANSFNGVEKSYAIQAGREIRVFVTPEKIDDLRAIKLAREIADRIQDDLKYPGEIKVNVIRELRAVEYAK
jgi:ribonucrease Y